MQPPGKLFKQLRRSILYALAVFTVTSAVALSIARLFLPEVQAYKTAIEQQLGAVIEQNVHIDEVDARLVGFTPTIIFKGVHLIDDSGVKELVTFKKAYLGISVIQSLIQKTLVPSDFTVFGTTISVLQKQDGSYAIQGLDVSALGQTETVISKELANWLMEQSSISIKESTVLWKQKNIEKWHQFNDVDVVLHNRNNRHQLTGQFQIPEGMGLHSKVAVDITGDLLNPKEWHGLVYLKSKGLRLSDWGVSPEFRDIKIKGGATDFELWGEWAGDGLTHLSGKLAIYDLQFQNTKRQTSSKIEQLKGEFDWSGGLSDWALRINHLEYATRQRIWKESNLVASWNNKSDASELNLGLSYAKIEDTRNLLIDTGLYQEGQVEALDALNPQGDLVDLHVNVILPVKGKIRYSILADIQNLKIQNWQNAPAVSGLNLKLNLNDAYGTIGLGGKNIILTSPKYFRQPVLFNELAGSIDLLDTGNGLQLQSRNFVVSNNDMKMAVNMMLLLPAKLKTHYMDLAISLKDVNIAGLSKYQPALILKEKLVEWIDYAFLSGTGTEGNAVFRGWSDQFPFKEKQGVMNGDFTATNVSMNYFKGWPEIEDVDAYGEFTSRGIVVKSTRATMHNGDIKDLVVTIDDFLTPILRVEGHAYGKTIDGFQFFSKTPVGKRTQRFVSKTRFEGDLHAYLTFSVALDKELAKKYPKRHSGYAETSNTAMYLMRQRLDVKDIKGRIYFSNKHFKAEGITAKLLEGDAKVRVASYIVGIKPVMEILGEGKFDARLLDDRFKKLGLLRVSGQLPWKGKLTLGYQKADSEEREPAKLKLESNLLGVTIDLPEPFRKPAETSRYSTMHAVFLPSIKTIMNLQYGDRMSTEMRLNNNYFPARIEIGEMKLSAGKANLPTKDEFRISGVVNNMDQYTWREVMQQHYNKYRKLRTRPIVDVPVIVDFAYISVPFDKTKAKPRKRYTSPKIMPAFKGKIDRFVFAGKEFGKLEFDSRRDNLGLAFDKLHLTSPHMEYNAKLTWHFINNWHKTKMKGVMKFSNIGDLVTGMGFPGKFEDGEGEVKLDLNWDNPFYVFRPGYADGKLELDLEDGIISAINPGAGRFLGLLSLSNLPRRLLLDFSDAGSGFAFDTLTGNINLKNGVASTDDVAIDSTIADVLAVGRVDVRNKQFDQLVTVTPQVAGTMPIVSGLLMGTGVIPLVWLFERLFGSDMDKSLSRQYHISGPWAKPKVERIDKAEDDAADVQADKAIKN